MMLESEMMDNPFFFQTYLAAEVIMYIRYSQTMSEFSRFILQIYGCQSC